MGVVQVHLPNVVRRQARPKMKGADLEPERVRHDHGAYQATAPKAADDLDNLNDPGISSARSSQESYVTTDASRSPRLS
ncbi:hypothetical protein E2562_021415 [Oryza meyeriana var. granulata]|uniref:Uncharacterized protein n=1 Tax=Oryza meyeriana var. granulata TaxID=110450 RepID=A0A6G1EXR2_9ORYZ|nr:hypothetical protein E2562_021415 [Oryza meyeriana var. granulata]